jgi:DNA-binding NarL/FixJ family response regulator
MPITLIVTDDHPVVRHGLSRLFENSDIQIVAEAENADQAVKLTKKHRPKILLLDVRLPNGDSFKVLETVRKRVPETQVVMHSAYENDSYIARAVALGAADYVLKGGTRRELINAVERAASGKPPESSSPFVRVSEALKKRPSDEGNEKRLTIRECQVLRHMAAGLSNRDIALSLGISIETVKEHVQNILRKTATTDRTQAAVWAIRSGMA